MLLYIHFPFCRSKCAYCAFASGPGSREDIAAWTRLVCAEARLWGRRLAKPELQTVYLGGGTPSLLPPESLHHLVHTLQSAFVWPQGIEWTLEANPDSFQDPAYAKSLYDLGVNRISFGVQSMADRELDLLGRAHTAAQAVRAVTLAREAGVSNISLDLLWGLPGHTLTQWEHTLEQALALKPRHLSCYGLTPEPDTPLAGDLEARAIPPLPDEDLLTAMYDHTVDALGQFGLEQYEIANFAQPGWESRHNSGYWQGWPYLGLGPAAVSTLEGSRWTNPTPLAAYARAVTQQTLGQSAHQLTCRERCLETLMLQLRTRAGLDCSTFAREFGTDPLTACPELCAQLQNQGLADIAAGTLRLTSAGMLMANSITERLSSVLLPSH